MRNKVRARTLFCVYRASGNRDKAHTSGPSLDRAECARVYIIYKRMKFTHMGEQDSEYAGD